jgi:phosphate transport system substrate-binding protein
MKFRPLSTYTTVILSLHLGYIPRVHSAPINGPVKIDGSSTVFPISEAVAEDFGAIHKSARVTVGTSGTGGGFKKFCAGETDVNNASRPIRSSELNLCRKNKVSFIELPIATDGLTVVVHPSNTFLTALSMADLKKIWSPSSKINNWTDLNSKYPNQKISLFGPGPDSGSFDYFTEEVVGKARSSRTDYTASEDDNMLIKGVSTSRFALGYFGHGYYMANKKRVKALAVDAGKGPIEPTDDNVASGLYPLSRQLFIYVNAASTSKPQVDAFIAYFLEQAKHLAKETGYLPLTDKLYADATERYTNRVLGPTTAKAKTKGTKK